MISPLKLLKVFSVLILICLVDVVLWQVLSRYVLNDPSVVSEELSRFLLMGLGFFGAVVTLLEKKHVALDYFFKKLPKPMQKTIYPLRLFSVILFCSVLFVGGGLLTKTTFQLEQKSSVLQLPMAWIYLTVPVTSLLFIFVLLARGSEDERRQQRDINR